MVTKQQAIQIQNKYIADLGKRIDAAITSNAQQGIPGCTVSYAPAGNGVANTLAALYASNVQNGGGNWNTSSVDTVNKTITIAP